MLPGQPARAQVRPIQGGGENAEGGGHEDDDDRIYRHERLPSLGGAMMLGAAVEALILIKFALAPPCGGTGGSRKFAAAHALTPVPAGLHYRVFRGELRSRS